MLHYLSDYPAVFSGALNDCTGFEEMLALAAEHFPLNDGKPMHGGETCSISAPSPFTGSSGSSSALSPGSCGSNKGNDSDSDSDVEPLYLDSTYRINDHPSHPQLSPTFEEDAPFLPHKRSTAIASTNLLKGTTSPLKQKARMTHPASHPPPDITCSSPPPPHRPVQNSSHSISTVDLDHDADSESDGNATDDEYVPSPALGPLKRRRASSIANKHSTRPPIPHILPTTSQSRPTKRARVPPSSRNKQASSTTAIELATASKNPNFICPECGWHQTNQRIPDFKRHLLTHTRSSVTDTDKGWWCKGVLVKDAARYNVPKTAEQFLFRNEWRIGGCLKTFSRRDALKRHLDNSNVFCVGRPCEAAVEL